MPQLRRRKNNLPAAIIFGARRGGLPDGLPKAKRLARVLTEWFLQTSRDLPWRRTTDPYAIWVSEVMLQQTQVQTVLPYWNRWMRELPTIEALASAAQSRIYKLWEGLGYYSRVRNLQSAAQRIVSEHDGHFPREFDQVHALPGIGRYTAGAICSIAFNQPKPVLDGNVVRVLTRVYGIGGDPHDKAVNQHLWGLAQDLVSAAASLANRNESSSRRTSSRKKPLASCSILNQSLMELGALVCRPRQPLCGECPVRTHCVARRQDRILEFPKPKVRATATALHFFAFLIRKRGKFLVRQRPAGVVNAHLWEFPNVPVTKGTDPTSAAKEVLGAEPGNVERRLVIKHSITRYRITLEVFEVKAKQVKALGCCWRSESQLQHLALASAHKKILTCLPPNE